MPEKSQVTSSNGLSNNVPASADAELVNPLISTGMIGDHVHETGSGNGAAKALAPTTGSALTEAQDGTSTAAESTAVPQVAIPPRQMTQATAAGRGATFKTLQLWEGTVTELNGPEIFVATLTDLTTRSNPDEQAEFNCSEVSPDDRSLIAPGSAFYWTVGTERTPGGQQRNVSTIQFKRLPAWTNAAIRRATERSAQTRSLFRAR